MTSPPYPVMALVAAVCLLASCSSRSVADETRLVEVHGDHAYLCLSEGLNLSDPPSCIADIGTRDNPELRGRMVPELISVLGGTTETVKVTASEQDGQWFLDGFAAPE